MNYISLICSNICGKNSTVISKVWYYHALQLFTMLFIMVLTPSISYAAVYEIVYSNHQVTKTAGDKPKVDKRDFTSTVMLAPNKVSIRDNQIETIYDCDNLVITNIDHGNRRYQQRSFYPEVMFRGKEMHNRLTQNAVWAAIENQKVASADNEFAVESLFGVKLRGSTPKDIKEKINGNVHSFIFDNQQIASIVLDGPAIKPEFKNSFKKFILYNFYFHPEIRNKILDYGRIFSHLKYEYKDLNEIITIETGLKSIKEVSSHDIKIPLEYKKSYTDKKS